MTVKQSLTGKRRLRVQKRLFKAPTLVLQVEVEKKGYIFEYPGCTRDVDCTFWRDATIEDLTEGITV